MLVSGFPKDKDGFEYFIEETQDPKRCRCIDNKITSRSKCKGYCVCMKHPGYLTEKLIKKHQCMEKECHYFYMLEEETEKATNKITHKFEDVEKKVVEKANKAIKAYEGIKIIKAERESKDSWKLYYVVIAKYDIKRISNLIKKSLDVNINLHKMDLSFDRCVDLIYGD